MMSLKRLRLYIYICRNECGHRKCKDIDGKNIDNCYIIKIIIVIKTMLSYCLKSKNNNENVNPIVLKTKYGKTVLSSKMCYMWW